MSLDANTGKTHVEEPLECNNIAVIKKNEFHLVQVKGTWKRKSGNKLNKNIKGRVSAAKM
jgi:hypothetical protein